MEIPTEEYNELCDQVRKMSQALKECKLFLQIHPYMCCCGFGGTVPKECEYCTQRETAELAIDKAIE